MKRLMLVLVLMAPLLFFLSPSLLAAWDVSPSQTLYEHSPGETFTVEIALSGAGNTIDALGFDFHYPSNLLQYNSADFSGTLLDAWMYKQVNQTSAGNLRVAGFTTSGQINSGTTGTLVKLSFTVKSGASGEGQFTINGFTDDLSGSTTTPATFRAGQEEGIHVAIHDTSGASGQTLLIPVMVEDDLTGKGVLAFEVKVETDTNIIAPMDVQINGTMTSSWSNIAFSTSDGEITIGGFDVSPLSGQGILIYIEYEVNPSATAGQTSALDLVSVTFNEGDPVAILQDGSFTVSAGFTVSGSLHYYNGNKPIDNADIHLDGLQTVSANNGDYEFANVLPGSYVLQPTKAGDAAQSISPFDAAKILQYSVGLITLTPMQLIAADVTGNGSVSPFDASQVLQYSVGIITQFSIGKDWAFVPDNFTVTETNWNSAPDSLVFDPLNSDMADQDFTGIVYGDVTGNWQLFRPGSAPLNARIAIQSVETKDENRLVVPLTVEISGNAISGKIDLQFNSGGFEFVSVGLAEENVIFAAKNRNDDLSVAFANTKTLSGRTLELNLIFKKKNDVSKANLGVQFQQLILDDRVVNAEVTSEQNNAVAPTTFHLDQNYPNPFNPETEISYQLPENAAVEVTIFNLQGQKIKTLFSGQQPAGSYRLKWKGRDALGNEVVTGVYICQLKAGEFIASRKMLLLK
ncbi:MAG: T9SS type A sorting domain-containing protein [Calditrichaeota bacterium]|nr:T9SS type A sorting domain-containing protein [Calditrichota bacterium]